MIVVEQRRGTYGLGFLPSNSATMGCPGARTIVSHRLNEADGSRLQITPRGVGDVGSFFSTVPTWAWVAGGALVAGLVGGAIYFKKRKG